MGQRKVKTRITGKRAEFWLLPLDTSWYILSPNPSATAGGSDASVVIYLRLLLLLETKVGLEQSIFYSLQQHFFSFLKLWTTSVSMISSLELHALDESSVQRKPGSTASLNTCFVRWYPLHRPLLWVLNNSIFVSLIFFLCGSFSYLLIGK